LDSSKLEHHLVQQYVAISRVKSKKGLKILILDDNGNTGNSTTNVVFREIFENV